MHACVQRVVIPARTLLARMLMGPMPGCADGREPGGGWADVGEATPSATTPNTQPRALSSPRGAAFRRTVPCLLPERDQVWGAASSLPCTAGMCAAWAHAFQCSPPVPP